MRSHYVSQFIIKSFAKAINVFDMKTGQIDEKRRPNKVFWEKDKYPDHIEKGMQKFESRVSNILYTKLSNKDEVRLTRYELSNLKIYLLICSVRTLKPSEFVKILNNTESINTVENVIKDAYPHLKTNKELNLSNDEIYNRALEIFTSVKNIQEIPHHKLCTLEIYYWSLPFLYSFMAIWDADPSMEFILSSSGMMSEYEGVYRLTGGISLSKKAYLYEKMQEANDANEKLFYANLIIQCEFMYENYDLFNIGSNRVLVNINPFFWLYNDTKYQKPNIWPCIFPYKELFTPPNKEYKNSFFYMEDDIFIYKPKKLDKIQTIYINSIILSQSPIIIGFNNPNKIVDSVCYSFWEHVHFNSVNRRGISNKEIINNLMQNFQSSPLKTLSDYCESKSRKIIKLDQFFEMVVSWILYDFRTNEYIYKYLLRMKDKITYDERLDFLGKGEKKIEYLQRHLNEILKHKN